MQKAAEGLSDNEYGVQGLCRGKETHVVSTRCRCWGWNEGGILTCARSRLRKDLHTLVLWRERMRGRVVHKRLRVKERRREAQRGAVRLCYR